MTMNEIMDMLNGILHTTGVFNFQFKLIIMWAVGSLFMYLAIAKKYEPLLLLPIGFGIFIVNFPLVPLMGYSHGHAQLLQIFYHYGLEWEVIPCIIFLGLGAMTRPIKSAPALLAPRAWDFSLIPQILIRVFFIFSY